MNNLKKLRKENNLTQDELSKKIGINLRTLQKWENGESSIRKKNAEKLAKHFGVSVGYLLGYEESYKIEDEALQSYIKITDLLDSNAEFQEIISEYEASNKKHGKWNLSLLTDTDNILYIEQSIRDLITEKYTKEQEGVLDESLLDKDIEFTYIALAFLPLLLKDFFGQFLTLSKADKKTILSLVDSLYEKDKGKGIREEYSGND